MKRANGQGTIAKLSGNRRKPYAVKITTGWSEKGTQQYKYLSYHATYREAEKALNLYIQDPYILCNYTFKELFDEYYSIQKKTKAKGTLKNHDTAIKHLYPLWDVKIKNLDRITLQRYYMRLDATPSAIGNIHKTLQGVISYAVKLGIMPVSSLDLLKAIDTTPSKEGRKNEHTVISKKDRLKLWENKDDDISRIILVYLYTGLRYEELFNLQDEDVHDDYIEIRHSKTKAGIRKVPLSNNVKKLLPIARVPKYTTFKKKFYETLPGYYIHDTRHTFITLLTEAGVDLRIIQAIVGHSRKATVTDRYTHIGMEAMIEAVNRIVV